MNNVAKFGPFVMIAIVFAIIGGIVGSSFGTGAAQKTITQQQQQIDLLIQQATDARKIVEDELWGTTFNYCNETLSNLGHPIVLIESQQVITQQAVPQQTDTPAGLCRPDPGYLAHFTTPNMDWQIALWRSDGWMDLTGIKSIVFNFEAGQHVYTAAP